MYCSVLLFLSGSDLMLIMFVALLLFGGDKLPEIARGLGKGIRDFKDASEGVKREINNQINSYEEKKTETATTSTPVVPELAAAQEPAASVTEPAEHIADDYKVPSAGVPGVHNTMPFVENPHPEAHSEVGAGNNEPTELPKEENKTEPVKTT